jgi:hypothetical protein
VRQKGLDTIGKRARLKNQAKKSSQMHECKLPLNKCMQAPPEQMHFPQIFFHDANSPWKHELGTFVPLVGNA